MGDEAAVEVQEALEAPERGSADELLDAGAHAPIDAMRHSAAHVMAEAVLDLFPGAKLGIGPAIDNGFYYDFDLPRSLTPEDLAAVEARMAASVAAAHPFVRTELSFDVARAAAAGAGQTYKVEILDDLAARARDAGEPLPVTTFYEHGPFNDLCKGPHVETTAALGPFRLLSVAGAYWRGDEKRPMLQRIYGTVWETQEELDQFLWRREEAKKRDHRKLGVRTRSLQLPRRQSRARPSGIPRASGCGGRSSRRCSSSRSGVATRRSARRWSSTRSCGGSRATGTSTGTTCSSSSPRARRSRSSR